MAKEKKSSTIITGFKKDGKILTGQAMYDELFNEMNKKFNPTKRAEKVIQPEPLEINYQEFC